jgi:flavodoxin
MNRTLIVYHSRSGHTRRLAQALARRLDADLDEIRIVQPLGGVAGYAMCAIEAIAGLTPALRPMHRDAAAYALVVVGTPVWFWNLSSPVRSWLEAQPLKQRVAFFCTMGGSGAGRVFAAMAELAGRQPVATLSLLEKELEAPLEPQVEAFARRLQTTAPVRPVRKPARGRALHAA